MTAVQPAGVREKSNFRWPDFFIVGAQRAGTTSLYAYLRGHPDIFMPEVKEPHYFAHVEHGRELVLRSLLSKVVSSEREYRELFRGAAPGAILGEASPFYLYDPDAPHRIKEKAPEARVVALLRDPVERAHSSYLVARLEGRESLPFYEAVVADYERPRKGLGVSHLYVELGLYYEQVERYLDVFGPDRVRVCLYDDLAADARRLVEDVCEFLGVPFGDGGFFEAGRKHGGYKVPRNRLVEVVMGSPRLRSLALALTPRPVMTYLRDHVLFVAPRKPSVSAEAREYLRDIFAEDVQRLQGLIGRDLSHWLGEG